MKLPTIKGTIDRRILANYRIDPTFMASILPKPFKPKIINGVSIGGICLIRLKNIRPEFSPLQCGIGSENAAHRIAVEWEDQGTLHEGVYVPRRDTNSKLNSLAGGRLFPGVQHYSKFDIKEDQDNFYLHMQNKEENIEFSGTITQNLPESSIFKSLTEASEFFKKGSLGYSPSHHENKYDGMELNCKTWKIKPLDVKKVHSSFFENSDSFPKGTVEFDCALLMNDIEHAWHSKKDICCN